MRIPRVNQCTTLDIVTGRPLSYSVGYGGTTNVLNRGSVDSDSSSDSAPSHDSIIPVALCLAYKHSQDEFHPLTVQRFIQTTDVASAPLCGSTDSIASCIIVILDTWHTIYLTDRIWKAHP